MRFLSYALLLLSAVVLAKAAAGRFEDADSSNNRFRLFKQTRPASVSEGRSLSDLLALKGGCPPTTTTTTISPTPTTTTGTTTTTTSPDEASSSAPSSSGSARDYNDDDDEQDELYLDDVDFELGDHSLHNDDSEDGEGLDVFKGSSLTRRGNNRPARPTGQLTDNARQLDMELRRQEEQNKLLRQRIQFLRKQNRQNRRRAQRARTQQRRRNQMRRRQAARRNLNSRRRLNRRNRQNRRRQRRNRRRN